jgi:hypothetical protein
MHYLSAPSMILEKPLNIPIGKKFAESLRCIKRTSASTSTLMDSSRISNRQSSSIGLAA